MAAESTGISLNSNFYMNNYYRFNRNAIKSSDRAELSGTELSYEDSRALRRALKQLNSFAYEKGENGENLVASIKAFADTYNNMLESAPSNYDTKRLIKGLKALTGEYQDKLEDIGITVEEDGKLKVSENILGGSSFEEIGRVFSKEADYVKRMSRIAGRMHNEAYDEVYAMMTGCGGRLNITL